VTAPFHFPTGGEGVLHRGGKQVVAALSREGGGGFVSTGGRWRVGWAKMGCAAWPKGRSGLADVTRLKGIFGLN
jgi:hypothetical protein